MYTDFMRTPLFHPDIDAEYVKIYTSQSLEWGAVQLYIYLRLHAEMIMKNFQMKGHYSFSIYGAA